MSVGSSRICGSCTVPVVRRAFYGLENAVEMVGAPMDPKDQTLVVVSGSITVRRSQHSLATLVTMQALSTYSTSFL